MNGLTLLALIALAVGVVVAYRAGALRARRSMTFAPHPPPASPTLATAPPPASPPAPRTEATEDAGDRDQDIRTVEERARLIRSYAAEADRVRRALATREAETVRLRALADDRIGLYAALAQARTETARYRQIVVDIENNAPPPLLESPTAPDDLKLIVGIGPVLERMLQQLGISTYRQIARWSERDVDEFDARLHEFPGRIRRDGWVAQARELHHAKYGDSAVARERS